MIPKPSFDPTPRPPLTTTLASAKDTPPPGGATCSVTCDVPDLPADHPPTLFLHGEKDAVVPISTMRPYQMKLDEQGTATSTEINADAGHEWLEAAVTRVPAWFDATP